MNFIESEKSFIPYLPAIINFFTLSLAFTFHYDNVRVPMQSGMAVVPSLTKFTEFLFSDYSLVFPLTLFLVLYFTEDYYNGVPDVLFSKKGGQHGRNSFLESCLHLGLVLFYTLWLVLFLPMF